MENIKLSTHLLFIVLTIVTVIFFYYATNKSKTSILIITLWLVLQAIMGIAGFYENSQTTPPRLIFMLLPTIILMLFLFNSKRGKAFIDSLNLKYLTLLHSVRILVEIVLLQLFLSKAIPEDMTFEGRNFDILSGISALLIFYFGYVKKSIGHRIILFWNIICLMLVINVVMYGILSAPYILQQLNFDQPNIAVLHFPFVWLAGFVVPVVVFAHLVAIRRYLIRSS
jgi:hypothetical protein